MPQCERTSAARWSARPRPPKRRPSPSRGRSCVTCMPMAERNLVQAVREALEEELDRDDRGGGPGEGVGGAFSPPRRAGASSGIAPGIRVLRAPPPADAKGLLKAAIRDPDPVIFLEPKKLYRAERQEVAQGDGALLPLGVASVVRPG